MLDVTPAPGGMRRHGRVYQRNDLLLENTTARCYMDAHVDSISNLIQRIHERFSGKISVKLTGTLSKRSERFVVGVLWRCMLKKVAVEWIGEYIGPEQGAAAQLQRIVHSLAPKRRTPDINAEDWQRALKLAPLRRVRWSDTSVELFGRACSEEQRNEWREEIRELAELKIGNRGGVVKKIPITEIEVDLRTALIRSLARDMGFRTASKGIDETRHIAITR
jgi:hypothetical protein